MVNRGRYIAILVAVAGLLVLITATAVASSPLSDIEVLGKAIFFDENLSFNANQACASCHGPEVGWTGPLSDTNAHGAVYEGSIPGEFGNRKPPSAAYATLSPVFHQDKKGLFVGGNFWDGRATGEKLGNPAADQAQFPFLNPVEQALGAPADVVTRVCDGSYGDLFIDVWGAEACDPDNVNMAYDQVALSIAAYEGSSEVNAFTSKYDYTFQGMAKLSKEEQRGFALFQGKGKCKLCHPSGKDALFTDFTFDNLGVPKNPENPVYDVDPEFVDTGLGGFLENAGYDVDVYMAELGKQKVPTLRNVDLRPDDSFVKAYGHNGYFKTLEGIVHFYNTRDVLLTCPGDYTEEQALAENCWPAPEVTENVNRDELGDLGLSPEEEADIVAYLKTLSDGYLP
ncbi:MAG: cytochrome c peroxidase [Anaerolineales bacterium]